jgi:hypothetical protein
MATTPSMVRRKCRRFLKLDIRRQLAASPHVVETAYALPFCRMTSRPGFFAHRETNLSSEPADSLEFPGGIYFADMAHNIKAYFYNAQY